MELVPMGASAENNPPPSPVRQPVLPSAPTVFIDDEPQVVIQTGARNLPNDSVLVTCPVCQRSMNTNVTHTATLMTHVTAGLLFIFGCWICCLAPYCIDSMQRANHYCSHCDAYIGSNIA